MRSARGAWTTWRTSRPTVRSTRTGWGRSQWCRGDTRRVGLDAVRRRRVLHGGIGSTRRTRSAGPDRLSTARRARSSVEPGIRARRSRHRHPVAQASGSTLYVGGSFATLGGEPRANLGAFDITAPTGTLTAWNPETNGDVAAIASGAGGTVYVGGSFDTVNGNVPRQNAAAFDASGTHRVGSRVLGGRRAPLAGSVVYVGGSSRVSLRSPNERRSTPTGSGPRYIDGTVSA